ncbi:aromatic ring-hydroxylating oxygenase subunit alpha [Segnochrobactrum spirostomi]|uniref:Aromatic ring-hydroxylating dioxygenase subunit alpha n=1 Tax=Segnochrobactrum spirostomi TaxID=2608987 RepID=A0A6A7Y5A9_9HYPH|nr:aromatic ring-hydroxylating dioxygenase subunit alpha [Segnochrobactrum spirostomi]MQT13358.1 aromatic ring-hydroxylating dioxygenase subunit alpha [Segnochrobactrum spirostomi]
MLDRPQLSIGDLVRARRPGLTFPAGLYNRADVFEADLDVFFHRQWIFAGFEADVPEPGDVAAIDVGGSSALIARGDDGIVRAFRNVCRHRGARLLPHGKHTVGKLVCPYHQWTYELDGDLIHADHMGTDFDRSCRGLKPVHLRSVEGLLFLCLAEEAPEDFADLVAEMTPRLAPFDLRNAKIAFEETIVEHGNWKLTMENNRECYHCAGSHPELNVSFVVQDFGFDPDQLSEAERAEVAAYQANNARHMAEWEGRGLVSHACDHLAGHVTNFRTQRLVIQGEGESQTLDTRAASRKLLGAMTEPKSGDLHFWTHHSWHHYMADHAIAIRALPLGPDLTAVHTKWLVHKDAVEGVDYDLTRLTEVWRATNAQDADLVALTQAGVKDIGYEPGPYSRFTEGFLDGFATWYTERMIAAGY